MSSDKFHLLAVDMGYGHQRAAYPLIPWSQEGAINLNNYEGMEDWEKSYWSRSQKSYDKISYFKSFPLVGSLVFKAMDSFQQIPDFYPRRDLSKHSLQQNVFFKVVKKGLGKKLIDRLNDNPLPLITTFFVGAYCAEYHKYQGPIYCVICDADISRAWAPINPKESKIIYLASTERAKERLLMYGVRPENIRVSGFPLPSENIGEEEILLKEDLAKRIVSLDPLSKFRRIYQPLINQHFNLPEKVSRPFSVSFAVGGAGAQTEIARDIMFSLRDNINEGQIKLRLIAGNRLEVKEYFEKEAKDLGISNSDFFEIVYHRHKSEYFRLFNLSLRDTDVLWTKPSELSLYSGLGLPILMSEPVGAQEVANRNWLFASGAGIDALDPKYAHEWLIDYRRDGRFARAAFQAYLQSPRFGTDNIIKEVFNI